MKKGLLLLFVLLFAGAVHALEVAGVDLPDSIDLQAGHTPLVLNGAGIRKKFFFKIYVAALYLPQRQTDAKKILDMDEPRRMQMDMLYSKVDREKFVEGWNEGFAANQSESEMKSLRARLDRFNGMFETLVEGDRVLLDYLPGEGTRVTVKGQVKGVIEGQDFNRALLAVWLGDAPVTRHLKTALLGL
ncbi:MAG: chalcone isomerase family protein [Candidatus Thiodiazotropha sp.]